MGTSITPSAQPLLTGGVIWNALHGAAYHAWVWKTCCVDKNPMTHHYTLAACILALDVAVVYECHAQAVGCDNYAKCEPIRIDSIHEPPTPYVCVSLCMCPAQLHVVPNLDHIIQFNLFCRNPHHPQLQPQGTPPSTYSVPVPNRARAARPHTNPQSSRHPHPPHKPPRQAPTRPLHPTVHVQQDPLPPLRQLQQPQTQQQKQELGQHGGPLSAPACRAAAV
jgi:hypothetical protein